jgi:transcription-repair coupling factor (superfamily II helicase)
VVHEKHGIGKFAGLVTMDLGGGRQDFLKILYAGDDRLFVPVENLDVLSRYKGGEAGQVNLDKLGGTGWEARKAKVKEDLMAMADELLATAAARETTVRTPFMGVEEAADTGMYGEFCAGFPYDLTDDQARVMEEVENDFSTGHPMDRLVVGDVGFGKTEVALRAAYLAAAAGKQVAVVCPTTLLARQHFDVFSQRFAGFPMVVRRLSRLVPAAEARETKEMMAQGRAHILVGTHALLGKEVKFRNLGLVVIDEEQRFGVAHKERLKSLRANVDILTLTATPIPRTLQMAVGGVRQLSLIATPPVDRQAVTTFVLPWDNKTLTEAIKRELTRGGQVYVVAPHVEDLGGLEDSLQSLVPGLRLGVAHGQLPEGRLEEVMGAFYEGKLDVLLATTIIESGLDVPKANTLIVYRSDRFGLAHLYQLRGRVGRSTRRAFAYFLLPEGGISGDGARRLQILQRLDGLGAGFTLASYDMDLRGFGNLLGKQQSGNIRDIGFELYNKLLREAVAEKQRKDKERQAQAPATLENLRAASVVLKLGLTYLIPDAYVPDVAERLQLYRRLANIHEKAGLDDFRAEMADRYGAPPPEVDCLLQVMELRNRAQALNIARLEVGEKGVLVAFEEGKFGSPQKLMGHILKHAGVVTVRPDQSLVWHRQLGGGGKVLAGVSGILAELEGLVR